MREKGARTATLRLVPVALLLLTSSVAWADDPGANERARAAYQRGAADYDATRFQAAAEEFARADDLAPNALVLEMALKASVRADDAELGMTLADRAASRGADGALAAAERAARERFASRVGEVRVTCPSVCTVTLDGAPVVAGSKRWVVLGPHLVEIEIDATVQRRSIRVEPGTAIEIRGQPALAVERPPARPASPPPAPVSVARASDSGGISPAWFWVGVAVTGVVGGAAAISGIDTAHRHQVFAEGPTDTGSSDGRASQLRTNVLLAATAVCGAATGFVGLALVRWRAPGAAVALGVRGVGLELTGRY